MRALSITRRRSLRSVMASVEFRELEAFAKFGSDLDASTKAVIENGVRNR